MKGLAFYFKGVDEVSFDDNLVDLVPGDEQEIVACGLKGRSVTWKYYGMEEWQHCQAKV